MKRLVLTLMLLAGFFAVANAQTNLVGRVYSHPNIMEDEIKAKSGEFNKKMDEAVQEEIAKAEKKKGRALTADEKAKIKKDAEEAGKAAMAVINATKTAVTATFKTEKDMVMQMKVQMDEESMKNAGVSWAQRKALKAAISMIPSTQKMKYTVQDNLIICVDGKDKDTLTISDDGKYLYGKMDEKTKFKLTRTK